MENHYDNLWSLSAQKYFWLKEPEIMKKIFNGFLPVRYKSTSSQKILGERSRDYTQLNVQNENKTLLPIKKINIKLAS